jgi:hypothetical protein
LPETGPQSVEEGLGPLHSDLPVLAPVIRKKKVAHAMRSVHYGTSFFLTFFNSCRCFSMSQFTISFLAALRLFCIRLHPF